MQYRQKRKRICCYRFCRFGKLVLNNGKNLCAGQVEGRLKRWKKLRIDKIKKLPGKKHIRRIFKINHAIDILKRMCAQTVILALCSNIKNRHSGRIFIVCLKLRKKVRINEKTLFNIALSRVLNKSVVLTIFSCTVGTRLFYKGKIKFCNLPQRSILLRHACVF